MSTSDRLIETKFNIRGVLESSKTPLSLKAFLNDYRDCVCEELPFRRLGFASAEQFLGSLSDTVIVRRSIYGIQLECVPNAKSAHIQHLVRDQGAKSSKPCRTHLIPNGNQRSASRFSNYNSNCQSFRKPMARSYYPASTTAVTSQNFMSQSKPPPPFFATLGPKYESISDRKPIEGACADTKPAIAPSFESRPSSKTVTACEPASGAVGTSAKPAATGTNQPRSGDSLQPRSVNSIPNFMPKVSNYPPGFGDMQPIQCPVYPTHLLPNAVETVIRMFLCLSDVNGVPLTKFNEEFHRYMGFYLQPEAFGFTGIFDLLSSLSFVKFHNSGNDFRVLYTPPCMVPGFPHHQNLGLPPMEQYPLAPPPFGMHPMGKLPLSQLPLVPMMQLQQQQQQQQQNFAAKLPMFNTIAYLQQSAQRPTVAPDPVTAPAVPCEPSPPKAVTPKPLLPSPPSPPLLPACQSPFDTVSEYDKQSSAIPCSTPPKKQSFIYVSDEIKAVFKQILVSRRNCLLLSELSLEYERITNRALDYTSCGCFSILELVGSIPDVFQLKRKYDSTDWILLKPRSANDDVVDSGRETGTRLSFAGLQPPPRLTLPVDAQVTPLLRRRVMQVVCSCPGGMAVSDFKELYQIFFDEEFELDTQSPYTLEAFFSSLSDIVYINFVNKDKIMIHELDEGRKLLASSAAAKDVAEECMRFRTQELPPGKGVGDYIEVFVSHTVVPSTFYVQLRGIDTSEVLDKLMSDINHLYSSKQGALYAMPQSFVAVGQPCVAVYPSDMYWYRAVIAAVKDKDTVEVLYVDYGNKCSISVTSLRMITKDFMQLPSQAMSAHLTNCAPTPDVFWSRAATSRFRDLAMEKPIVARVSDINESLSLILCDTSGPDDMYVQDMLICEGFARLRSVDEQQLDSLRLPRSDSNCTFHEAAPLDHHSVHHTDCAIADSNICLVPVSPTEHISRIFPNRESTPLLGCIVQPNGYILPFKMTSYSLLGENINVISLNGVYYIPTFDISKFIWPKDFLRPTLLISQHNVDYFFIRETMCKKLYAALYKFLTDETDATKKIALCPLNAIPGFLSIVIKLKDKCQLVGNAFKDLVNVLNKTFV